MAFIVVEMTGAIVFMLKLAIPLPAKGHEGGITTNPLLTTARFDQRHPLTSTEPTMLASNRFGQTPPDLVVKLKHVDIVGVIL